MSISKTSTIISIRISCISVVSRVVAIITGFGFRFGHGNSGKSSQQKKFH